MALKEEALEEVLHRSVIVEHEGAGCWDDVVEHIEQNGSAEQHAWQVKSGTLKKEELEGLVRDLIRAPQIRIATLAMTYYSDVKSLGQLSSLTELLRRLRAAGGSAVQKSHPEQRWWDFLCATCGSVSSALDVAKRLNVECLGNELDVATRAKDALRLVYNGEAVGAVYDHIYRLLAQSDGSKVFSALKLRHSELQPFEGRRLSMLPAERREARDSYLQNLKSGLMGRRILKGLQQLSIKVESVWVPPRIVSIRNPAMPPVDLRQLAPGLHFLVGPVGSGKTELLASTARELASLAMEDRSASIPLLVDASALCRRDVTNEGLVAAASELVVDITRPLAELLQAGCLSWVILVDGLDEAPERGVQVIEALRRRFPASPMLVATRPDLDRLWPETPVYAIEPWTPADSTKLIGHLTKAGATLISVGQILEAGSLLERPLTATLLWLASDHASVWRSRTGLLEFLAKKILQSWAERRDGGKERWEEYAREVRRFALMCVAHEAYVIPRNDLERLAGEAAPDRSERLVGALWRDFGLLVPSGEGYVFALRPMAEFLAGQALEQEGERKIRLAARHAWGAEAVRYALGLWARKTPKRLAPLLVALAKPLARDEHRLRSLRRLLVAIRVAADVGDKVGLACQSLAQSACKGLFDDEAPWRAARVADAVAELARAGGPTWDVLWPLLRARCEDTRSAEQYFQSIGRKSRRFWKRRLMHSDPAVRSEAIQRLRANMSSTSTRHLLLVMLFDEPTLGSRMGSRVPAIEAALALRATPRDRRFRPFLEAMRAIIGSREQHPAAAAAIALRPTEAPVDELAQALASGAQGLFNIPREVFSELAASPEGQSALAIARPTWAQPSLPPLLAPSSVSVPLHTPVPSSLRLRQLAAHAALPAVLRGDKAVADAIPELRGFNLDGLFHHVKNRPELIEVILQSSTESICSLSHYSQDILGRALGVSTSLQALVIHNCNVIEEQDVHQRVRLPGRSLEHVITAEENEVSAIYARWLPKCSYSTGLYSGLGPRACVFENTLVRNVASNIVERAWIHATQGMTQPDGRMMHLSANSCANILGQFVPVWSHRTDITDQALRWLNESDVNMRNAGARILSVAPLSQENREDLIASLRELLVRDRDRFDSFSRPVLVEVARKRELVVTLAPELRRLIADRREGAIGAARALLPIVSKQDAMQLSQEASLLPIHYFSFDGLDSADLRFLVELAPHEWEHRVVSQLEQIVDSHGTLFRILASFPLRTQRKLCSILLKRVKSAKLPWRMGMTSNEPYRPVERALEMLFEAGLVTNSKGVPSV